MKPKLLREFLNDYSYNQFMIRDAAAPLAGGWTPTHSDQGFCRLDSAVSFLTIIPGYGDLPTRVLLGPYVENPEDVRVIAVPFHSPSGKVLIGGPEWSGEELQLPPGHYRLWAAQRFVGKEQPAVDLYFEPMSQPLDRSCIVKADEEIHVDDELLETAEIA